MDQRMAFPYRSEVLVNTFIVWRDKSNIALQLHDPWRVPKPRINHNGVVARDKQALTGRYQAHLDATVFVQR
ncbi:MAG: hypothetical protein ACJARY_001380 [Candidatus Azotimanducaceae bacterium]|jgi:hypothetical protein